MGGPEQVRDVVHGRCRELGEDLGLDLQEIPSKGPLHADPVVAQQPVLSAVRAGGQRVGIAEVSHSWHLLGWSADALIIGRYRSNWTNFHLASGSNAHDVSTGRATSSRVGSGITQARLSAAQRLFPRDSSRDFESP